MGDIALFGVTGGGWHVWVRWWRRGGRDGRLEEREREGEREGRDVT